MTNLTSLLITLDAAIPDRPDVEALGVILGANFAGTGSVEDITDGVFLSAAIVGTPADVRIAREVVETLAGDMPFSTYSFIDAPVVL